MPGQKVTGLWPKAGKNGTYLSGKASESVTIDPGGFIAIYKNENPKENGPTHSLVYYAPDGARTESARPQAPRPPVNTTQQGSQPEQPQPPQPPQQRPYLDGWDRQPPDDTDFGF